MILQLHWCTILSILLCIQQVLTSEIKCEPEESSCSQCYAELVGQVTTNDRNQFEVQRTFFPPDKAPPLFVTVFYHYYEDNITLSNKTDVWFWSTSTFYLHHPLHVFQFTSLLFSDLSKRTAVIHLNLRSDCLGTCKDHMRLFTQRVRFI